MYHSVAGSPVLAGGAFATKDYNLEQNRQAVAKHKKRKSPRRTSDAPPEAPPESAPTGEAPPDTVDSPGTGGPGRAEPTEPTEPIGPPDPAGPARVEPVSPDISERNRKLGQLYWLRIALAVVAGVSATFIFEPFEGEERRWASIGYMIVLFLATIFVAKAMDIRLPPSDRKKIVTQALPSYIFLYLFVWIMSYTITVSLGSDSGLTSPLP